MQAYKWAKAHLTSTGRYHLLRVEDLAVADAHTEVGLTNTTAMHPHTAAVFFEKHRRVS
jgi:hypothetical protein